MDATQRRAEAKRRQIVEAARETFLGNGFAGSSMDAIVATAQVSKQTLYRYFPSKNELFAAVLTSEVEIAGIFPATLPRLESIDDLRAALLAVARVVTDEMLQPDRVALMRLVFGEAFRLPELRETIRDALPGQFFGMVQRLLAAAAASGLVSVDRLEIPARMYVGSVFSYVALDGFLRVEPLPPPPTADLERLVDAFLRSVEAPR
ncbi:MAG: TetR/AcrR family transcriptional regulator [Propionicimonas sp.]|nr:TetR/AcrR family transcriptional regulator [Propionicimonas sp.]